MSNTIQGITGLEAGRPQTEARAVKPAGDRSDFFETLQGVWKQVEQLQGDAQAQVAELAGGNGQDIHSALVAVEKADLAFQMMMQVRNKIVQAYQEISRMPF